MNNLESDQTCLFQDPDDKPPSEVAGCLQQATPSDQFGPTSFSESCYGVRPLVRSGGQLASSDRTRAFRNAFFASVSEKDWNNWRWQLRNRVTSHTSLAQFLNLHPDEIVALRNTMQPFPFAVTPYYLSLIDPVDPNHPLRRTVVPTRYESVISPGEEADPLHEDQQTVVPGLVHRYPDRVLLLVHDHCAVFCRYCTRSRMVGRGKLRPHRARIQGGIEYIRKTPAVRDVLVSGGDPLLLSDDFLDWLLAQLRAIPHVEIIRIGTKVPAVLPQRITTRLVRVLRRYHPLWMSLHFTHPDELTPEVGAACSRLADAGIPLGSQTVLLQGVNDSVDVMRSLMHGLMQIRVRPYYLYQCDPIVGSAHFRTPVETGLRIIDGLRGHTSGYAVPTYVIDAPGGGGKIPVGQSYVVGCDATGWQLENYEGRQYHYPELDVSW